MPTPTHSCLFINHNILAILIVMSPAFQILGPHCLARPGWQYAAHIWAATVSKYAVPTANLDEPITVLFCRRVPVRWAFLISRRSGSHSVNNNTIDSTVLWHCICAATVWWLRNGVSSLPTTITAPDSNVRVFVPGQAFHAASFLSNSVYQSRRRRVWTEVYADGPLQKNMNLLVKP